MIWFTSSFKSEVLEMDWFVWISSDKLVISSNSSVIHVHLITIFQWADLSQV